MKTESELFEEREAAQQRIHRIILPAVIQCADAGFTAKDLLAYLTNAREGMIICAAFNLAGVNFAENLRLEMKD
jgi:hypothetical protein